jgi:hydrogenase maturation protein HypF
VFSPTLERIGGLIPVPMPGGDLATRYPVRMVAGVLHSVFEVHNLTSTLTSLGLSELESSILLEQIERKVNVPLTSSTGRVLDAVASALDICQKRTYDGEPAMTLEGVAHYGHPDITLPLEITTYQRRQVLDTRPLLAEVLHAKEERKSVKNIAASAQATLARGIATIATEAAESAGIKNVGLSGGVAYNKAIIKTVEDVCKSHGFALYTNTKVPRGDGGISFGQAVLTAMVKSGDSGLTL